jgi:hypothetical protein
MNIINTFPDSRLSFQYLSTKIYNAFAKNLLTNLNNSLVSLNSDVKIIFGKVFHATLIIFLLSIINFVDRIFRFYFKKKKIVLTVENYHNIKLLQHLISKNLEGLTKLRTKKSLPGYMNYFLKSSIKTFDIISTKLYALTSELDKGGRNSKYFQYIPENQLWKDKVEAYDYVI